MIWENGPECHDNRLVFCKVNDTFGGLSNMSNEFPLRVGNVRIGSSEALYQACRYPHRPDWQREILDANHAMAAKMKAKKEGRRQQSRPDWEKVSLDVMRWVLRVKLAQHFRRFSALLRCSKDRPIVEQSRRDRFWGVVSEGEILRGDNWLGKLWMELRAEVNAKWAMGRAADLIEVQSPAVDEFLLLGEPIGAIDGIPLL